MTSTELVFLLPCEFCKWIIRKRHQFLPLCHSPQNPSSMAPMGPRSDRDVLLVLHRLTDGANWKNKTNWGSSIDLSEWHGVKTNDEGRVVELSLGRNSLRGMPRHMCCTSHKKRLLFFV